MATSDPSGSAARRRDAAWFALLWLPYAWLVARFWFVTDDAYISFRYARNFARGLGMRYNAGEEPPVEGYSNFLWTLYAAALEALGLDPGLWTALLSAACGTLLLWRVFRALVDSFAVDRANAWLAALALACTPPFALWSTGGLETMPSALALFVVFERLVLRRPGPDAIGGAAAALALALLRIEGIAWAAAVGMLAAIVRAREGAPALRPLARYAALVLGGFALHLAWRLSYYGMPLPNTAYAKGGFSAAVLARGARYAIAYLLTFLPLGPLLGLAVLRDARWRGAGAAAAALAFGAVAFAVAVGGDFMAMGRFLVPGLPFAALLFGALLQRIGEALPQWRRAAPAAAAAAQIAIAGLPAFDLHVVPASLRNRFHFRHNFETARSEYRQWQFMNENAREWRAKGLALRAIASPGDSVVLGAIGAVGYYSDLVVYDRLGLVDREVAHQPFDPTRLQSPGHDRDVGALFFLDRQPTFLESQLLVGETLRREVFDAHVQRWLATPGTARYAADFRVSYEGEGELGPSLLLVWRMVAPGQDAGARWESFFARARSIDWTRLRGGPSG
jgi:hypothetical protein